MIKVEDKQVNKIMINGKEVLKVVLNGATKYQKVTTQWECPFTGTITGSANNTNTYTTIDSNSASGLYIIQNASGGTSIQYNNGTWITPTMTSGWPTTNAPFLIYSPNLGYAYWPYYDSQYGYGLMYAAVNAVRYRRQSTSVSTQMTFIPGMQIYFNQSYPPAIAGTINSSSITNYNLQLPLQNNRMLCMINTGTVQSSNAGSRIQFNGSTPFFACYANNYQANINRFTLNNTYLSGNYNNYTFSEYIADLNSDIGASATFTPASGGVVAILELIPV